VDLKAAALLPAAEVLGPLLLVVTVEILGLPLLAETMETLGLPLRVAAVETLDLPLLVETMETLGLLLRVETNFENVDRIDMDTYALPLYNACYVTICIIMKIGECLLLLSID
jgi:hypothetical protein